MHVLSSCEPWARCVWGDRFRSVSESSVHGPYEGVPLRLKWHSHPMRQRQISCCRQSIQLAKQAKLPQTTTCSGI